MKTKIFAVLALLFFVGALFWAIPILKNRYFNNSDEKNGQIENTPDDQPDPAQEESVEKLPVDENTNSSGATSQEQTTTDSQDAADEEEDLKNESNEMIEISKKDCENKCQDFEEFKDDLKYCQERCGLDIKASLTSDCSKFQDLEKDYCLKDLAIKKIDLAACAKIQDDGIKKTCQNRIAEDLLDVSVSDEVLPE